MTTRRSVMYQSERFYRRAVTRIREGWTSDAGCECVDRETLPEGIDNVEYSS
ncbi:hypothetical protein PK12_004001 [Salmonella enterica subsp. enterica]|nr:hypothetical protein [Salmonella enterica subsp. enterica serovar Bonariensis]EEA7820508.1 hypothetical protein [Salmonella enterica subsp. enterica serovar Miami]